MYSTKNLNKMKTIKAIISPALILFATNGLSAQDVYKNENNVANNGYDLVSYFTVHMAERGSADFSVDHGGTTYYFVNAEHQKAFRSNPAAYLPQFDGYCAFAVAKMKKKVPSDPKTFRIDDGKLYLFYNDYWEGKPFNTIIPWLNNEAELEKLAATNWESIAKQ